MSHLILSRRVVICFLIMLAALAGCTSSAQQASPGRENPTTTPLAAAEAPKPSPSTVWTTTSTPAPTLSASATVTIAAPALTPSPMATSTRVPTRIPTAKPTSAPTATPPPTQTPLPPSNGKVIAIDPGHGGYETGAVHTGTDGHVDLIEKDVDLAIALRLSSLLENAGFRPVLTRQSDRQVNVPARDLNGDGKIDGDDDLQGRVDIANDAGASLLLSIHNNGASSPSVRGTSTWYCADRPFGDQNRRLAQLVQSGFVRNLRAAGYADVIDGGANDDPPLEKPFGHLFINGPKTPRVARASNMPSVTGESLFVTSDGEAKLLADDAVRERIAQAYLEAVTAFFSGQ